ncbi:MAG: APC family permease [Anaerolineae bacterium]|nr:APC family permease [Anaerolineae bacterium]
MASATNERAGLWRRMIGQPLATKDLPHQAVSRVVGLAVFASDALSSTAYAPEEVLVILAFAGSAYFGLSIPIALAISGLIVIVTLSYRQTIHAYPNGGGAYIVARDNLGELPAQVAGAALLTDYILTVAVSISSGVAQIVSAIPDLRPYRVEIALIVIIVMTIINLRGVKESGRVFAVPTYFFLAMAFLVLVVGGVQFFNGSLGAIQVCAEGATAGCVEPVHYPFVESLTLFLVLRAFSSGCTALTGIEAISNGITAFRKPRARNAAATLVTMSTILVIIFIGFTLLAHQVGAVPSHSETVVSQMAGAVYGYNNLLYFITLVSTTGILLMAANTSYADFPRLAALIAADGFLPRQLTIRGSRLVFSVGIMSLGLLAGLLVVFLGAQTSALIPLYAIGVFLSFTMSQTGMVVRAWRIGKLKPGEKVTNDVTTLEYDPHWRGHMILSGVGATLTATVMMVFAVTKFRDGAWFIVVLIPTLVYAFFRIHWHYRDVAAILSASKLRLDRTHKHVVSSVVLIDDVHANTLRLVDYAKSLGVPWKAIHISIDPRKTEIVQKKWNERVGEGELYLLESPYRQTIEPIRDFLEEELANTPNGYVNVIMGHLVMDTLWEQALHQNSAVIFNLALANLERVVVTTVPFQIHHLRKGEDGNGNGNGDGNGNGHANGHDHGDLALPPPWPLEEASDAAPTDAASATTASPGDTPVTPPTP